MEVGDVVTVPEQVPIELETAEIGGPVPSKEIAKNEGKIDSIEKVMGRRNVKLMLMLLLTVMVFQKHTPLACLLKNPEWSEKIEKVRRS